MRKLTFSAALACCLVAWLATGSEAGIPGRSTIAGLTGEPPRTLPKPTREEVRHAVEATLEAFTRSVAHQDMTELYEAAAGSVREQLTPELLLASFKPFLRLSALLSPIAANSPVIVSFGSSATDGAIGVEGHYAFERHTLSFRATFVREGLVWRWSNLHLKLLPAEARPGT